MVDFDFINHLVCPKCKSAITISAERLVCLNEKCGKKYLIRDGIPVMLVGGGDLLSEDSGYYPKVKGGTMEDNTDPEFSKYDTKVRTHYLRKYISNESRVGRVLDLCCSKAPFMPYLRSWGYSNNVFGVDLLFEQLVIARNRGVKVVQGNALTIPFPTSHFSIVIFTDALVHLVKVEDQYAVFQEVSRVLERNGCLIMTVASLGFAALKAITSDIDYLKSDYCTFFSLKEVKQLADSDFVMENFDAFGFYPFVPGSTRNAKFSFLLDRILNNPVTRKFGMVYYLKLRKR